MFTFSPSTQRRLVQLAMQPNSIWEGDRLSLNFQDPGGSIEDLEENRDCILWVDGVNGVVRAMDLVPANSGQEAIVRTLLQAMEHPLEAPNHLSRPARPKKVVVRSRELQFFLRGVLKDLDIIVEYQPELPLIDEFFSGMQRMMMSRTAQLPAGYTTELEDAAQRLWELAPWQHLADHEIIQIDFPELDVPTLHLSILGKLGMEFGVLFYRSLESLQRFRQAILYNRAAVKEAFLRQDCLFLNFVRSEDFDEDIPRPLISIDWEDLELEFGCIHPLEGVQGYLEEEDAQIMLMALEALIKFIKKHRKALATAKFPALQSRLTLSFPPDLIPQSARVMVQVNTNPDLAQELMEMTEAALEEDEEEDDLFDDFMELENLQNVIQQIGGGSYLTRIQDNLVPTQSLITLSSIPREICPRLGYPDLCHATAESFPVVIVQTTRPQAKVMVDYIEAAGGLLSISLAPVDLHSVTEHYELSIVQLGNGELQIISEFNLESPPYQRIRKAWENGLEQTNGRCALLITQGVTGKRRGLPPVARDVVALLEAPFMPMKDVLSQGARNVLG